MHKESHQYVDIVDVMRPITKWNARVTSRRSSPRSSARRSRSPRAEKPGATHLELPEDVMAARSRRRRWRAAGSCSPSRARASLLKAADLIRNAINPVALAGNGVVRAGASAALREFSRATGIAGRETFMGKGLLDYEDPHALGTVGLQSRDYAMAGFEDADVVITIGYDLVEHAPQHWNPGGTRRSSSSTRCRPRSTALQPEVELLGDMYHVLSRLAEECRDVRFGIPPTRLAALRRGHPRALRVRQGRRPLPDAAAARAVGDPQGRWAARTSSSPTSGCTSCGSGDVPRPRAQHGPDRQRPGRAWASRSRAGSPPSSSIPRGASSPSTATAASS
jgi:acetolactate synthase-1/2/3 large subunit